MLLSAYLDKFVDVSLLSREVQKVDWENVPKGKIGNLQTETGRYITCFINI